MSLIMLASKGRGVSVPVEPNIGDPYGGGFYYGKIVIVGLTYRLVVADKSAETSLAVKTTNTADTFAFTWNDGLTNSNFINNAAHPAAQYCRAYTGGGFNDWYHPSRDEAELLYRNLKPSTASNATGARPAGIGGGLRGENPNSDPVGAAYTTTNPPQTSLVDWQPGGSQAFNLAANWASSSLISGVTGVACQIMNTGDQFQGNNFTSVFRVRPVRKVLIA